MKLVLDTNVTLSGLMYPAGGPGRILTACRRGKIEWFMSQTLLDELERALQYPKISKILGWNNARIFIFIESIRFHASFVATQNVAAPMPKDPNDKMVLQTLIASGSDYLISGDKDLLAMAPGLAVISVADFLNKHGI